MRIALVNPYARGASYSGPNLLMDRLFGRLSDSHDFTLVAGNRGAAASRSWVIETQVPTRFGSGKAFAQARWSLACGLWLMLHHRRFDLVHVHGSYLFNLLTVLPLALLRLPYVVLPLAGGGDLAIDSRSSRLWPLRSLRRFVIGRASAGFALAPQVADELSHWGLDPDHIFRLGNAVDTQLFSPSSKPFKESRTLVFVGMMGERKNPYVVLEALAELRKRGYRTASATFVGPFVDAASETKFRRLADDLKVTQGIEIVGFQNDVRRHLRAPAVFVLPSRQEGLPGALVEAMASGLPTVVTDAGSMGEVVTTARCGFVIRADAISIADAVERLWTEPDLWSSCALRGREFAVDRFSLQVVAEEYQSVIERVNRGVA